MKLNFKSFGEGEAIIIVHGLLGSLDNWQTIAKKLAEQYRVFIVDMRNHGKSPHDKHMSYALMAEDLLAFMNDHQLPEAHLLGHSMGGKVVTQLAVLDPARVLKLVIVDINPFDNSGDHETILSALKSLDVSVIKSRGEADQILSGSIKEWGVRQFLLKNLARNTEGGFSWKFNLNVLISEYDEIRKGIDLKWPYNGECLVVHGSKSNYIREKDVEFLRDKLVNVQFETVWEAGHWVHADQPDEFMKVIKTYLAT